MSGNDGNPGCLVIAVMLAVAVGSGCPAIFGGAMLVKDKLLPEPQQQAANEPTTPQPEAVRLIERHTCRDSVAPLRAGPVGCPHLFHRVDVRVIGSQTLVQCSCADEVSPTVLEAAREE